MPDRHPSGNRPTDVPPARRGPPAEAPDPETAAAFVSHRGARRQNEDSVLVRQRGRQVVLGVADGMGGYAGGREASRMAVAVLQDLPTEPDDDADVLSGESIDAAYRTANERIVRASKRSPELAGMGTTLVSAFVSGARYRIANVGDSRAYLIRDGGMHQVTRDHSAIGEAIRDGAMTAEEAAHSPYAHALTRSLGSEDGVQVDVFPEDGSSYPALPGDILLLCSDGFWGVMDDGDVVQEILGAIDLDTAASNLAALALKKGSTDNITVVLFEFGRAERSDEMRPVLPALQGDEPRAAAKKGDGRRDEASTPGVARRNPYVLLATGLSLVLVGLIATAVWVFFGRPGKTARGTGGTSIERPGEAAALAAATPRIVPVSLSLTGTGTVYPFPFDANAVIMWNVKPDTVRVKGFELRMADSRGTRVVGPLLLQGNVLAFGLSGAAPVRPAPNGEPRPFLWTLTAFLETGDVLETTSFFVVEKRRESPRPRKTEPAKPAAQHGGGRNDTMQPSGGKAVREPGP